MKNLVRESIINETTEFKDIKRIKDLFHRSKGSDSKLLQLTQNMANSIDDIDKAQRRAEAAWEILGKEDNPIADIFLKRIEELKDSSKTLKPKQTINFSKPISKIPDKNPEPDYDNLTKNYGNYVSKKQGVIYLPSYSAIALWDWEITGQLSDGAWENSKPDDHYKFWCNLLPRLGIPEVKSRGRCKKDGYNLTGLIEYVGDRMVQYGRFGKAAGEEILKMGGEVRSTVEDFPKEGPFNLEEWKQKQIIGKDWRAKDYYWVGLEQKHIDAFYNTKYDEKDMRKDLSYIKEAMKKRR